MENRFTLTVGRWLSGRPARTLCSYVVASRYDLDDFREDIAWNDQFPFEKMGYLIPGVALDPGHIHEFNYKLADDLDPLIALFTRRRRVVSMLSVLGFCAYKPSSGQVIWMDNTTPLVREHARGIARAIHKSYR